MTRPGALAALGALALLAGSLGAAATLVNPSLSGPVSTTDGAPFYLVLTVQNGSSTDSLDNVVPSLGWTDAGMVAAMQVAPSPVATLGPYGAANFTWTFSGGGCGSVQFTASASALSAGTPVPTPLPASHTVSLYCTPTVTPTSTPVVTATPTPWIVYGTATPVPREGWAGIPGNLYHPLLGQPLQLQAVLPEASTLTVELFDRLGRRVKRFEQAAQAGSVSLAWDGRSDDGVTVSSGIYAAVFRARGFTRTVKFAVIK